MRRALLTIGLLAVAGAGLTGCGSLDERTGDKVLTGAAVGAASGAVVGILTGGIIGKAVVGAAAGAVTGVVVDQIEKAKN